MEIRTKFNVGDKIFALKEFEGVDDKGNLIIRIDIQECIVHFINIGISKRGRCIKYTYDLFPEEDCFATKEEAQKECDKRNATS